MTITMGRQMGFGNQQVIDGGSCEEVSIHADYVMSMETMCSIYPQMAIFQGFENFRLFLLAFFEWFLQFYQNWQNF